MSLTLTGCSGDDGAALDLNFAALGGLIGPASVVTFTRGSTATDLLYTASAGTYNTFAINASRINTGGTQLGLLIEESRIQQLGVTDAPATQTVTLATGAYTLWMIGSGSVTPSAGTGTATGMAAATLGAPNVFTVTVAGTFTFTVSGTVTNFQCEKGAFATSYIPNPGAAGTTVTRSGDVATVATSAFAFNPSAGTVVADILNGSGTTVKTGLTLNDGTLNNYIELYGWLSGATGSFDVQAGGANQSRILTSALGATPVSQKFAAAYSTSDAALAYNGSLSGSGTPATIPVATVLSFSVDGAGSGVKGQFWYKRVRYFNRRLPNAQLQSLST